MKAKLITTTLKPAIAPPGQYWKFGMHPVLWVIVVICIIIVCALSACALSGPDTVSDNREWDMLGHCACCQPHPEDDFERFELNRNVLSLPRHSTDSS